MKKERDYYFLLERDESNPERVPATKRISATASVILEGDTMPTKIRYARGVRDFREEEQGNVSANNIQKPSFVKGVLVVKPHEKVLLDFLRNHPSNRDSLSTSIYGERKTFFEHNPEAVAKEEYENMEDEYRFYDSVFKLSYTKQIKPMCYLAGIDTEDDNYIVKKNFVMWAMNNVDVYEEWLDKEFYIERTRAVIDALDSGILRINGQTVLLLPRTELVTFASGDNVIDSFVNWTYGEGMEKWKTVYSMLQSKLNRTNDKTKGDREVANNPLFDELMSINSDELFDRAKEEGVIEWKPPFFVFKDVKVGKGKEASVKQLDTNRNKRRNIILAMVNKNEAELKKED